MNNLLRTVILPSFELAYGSLRRQKGRALLTMLAIAIGIAAVITINAAGKGIQRLVLSQLDAFGPDTFNIETRVPVKNASDFGSIGITITTLRDRDIETVRRHPNIAAAFGTLTSQESVSYNGQIKKIMLFGRGYEMPLVETVAFSEGRFFTKEEEDALAPVAVLGSKAKEKLFGDESADGKIVYIGGKAFRVIGVFAPRGSAFFFDMDNLIVLPTKTMQKRVLGIEYVQSIMGKMRDVSVSKDTADELTELIRENHRITDPNRDDFVIHITADAQTTLTTVTGGLTLLLLALVCISLVVGGVGIMNIMYVSVAERTFEIGLRKSLGATRQNILWQFLSEAILITTGGGVAGVLLGALTALLIYGVASALGFQWVYSVSLGSILLAVSFSAFIGLIFGLYPARKAALLNPIDALRKE